MDDNKKELSAVEKLRLIKLENEKNNLQDNQSLSNTNVEIEEKPLVNDIVDLNDKNDITIVEDVFEFNDTVFVDDYKDSDALVDIDIDSILPQVDDENLIVADIVSEEDVEGGEFSKILEQTNDEPELDITFAFKPKHIGEVEDIVEDFENDDLDELLNLNDEPAISEDIKKETPETQGVIEPEKSVLFEWAEALAVAILLVSFIFIFIVRIVSVSGQSMLPTLEDGDRLIISKLFYTPEYKDVIVLTKTDYMSEPMVKRVIATEGQTVDIDFSNGNVFIDGNLIEEKYINEPTLTQYDVSFPQTVPEGHVFVMGDNRNHSSDSRVSGIGMISEDLILGEVIVRLFPYSKIGAVE